MPGRQSIPWNPWRASSQSGSHALSVARATPVSFVARHSTYKGVCGCAELYVRDENLRCCAVEQADERALLASGAC
jgi:hypothetical protein